MPESTAVPPCPKARRDRMSNRSCARGAVQEEKIFNGGGGGKSQAFPAALPGGPVSTAGRQSGRRLAHAVCQWKLVHSAGFRMFLSAKIRNKFETTALFGKKSGRKFTFPFPATR